jgi:hypothetical protein
MFNIGDIVTHNVHKEEFGIVTAINQSVYFNYTSYSVLWFDDINNNSVEGYNKNQLIKVS